MQYVFVFDKNKKPLDPCHPARARQILKEKRAIVFRRYPFTILLKGRELKESVTYAHQIKFDPGSRTTGIALVREGDEKLLWAGELAYRGQVIKDAMDSRKAIRHNRRSRKCRYRPPRFDNRRRRAGWLPPSLESWVANFQTWARRPVWSAAVEASSMELVKFDTRALQNPEIMGVEYQQGELRGYEIREYLLEKRGRKCAYCDKTGVPLEVENILPRSRGGSKRFSNLTLSCHECNQEKGTREGGRVWSPGVPRGCPAAPQGCSGCQYHMLGALAQGVRKRPTRSLRNRRRTKYNRTRFELPKPHWIDAACVGEMAGPYVPPALTPLYIRVTGHGCRQMCRMDKYGFPRTGAKGTRRR